MRIGLVSCGKSKLSRKAPARELYTSALFRLLDDRAGWLPEDTLGGAVMRGLEVTVALYAGQAYARSALAALDWEAEQDAVRLLTTRQSSVQGGLTQATAPRTVGLYGRCRTGLPRVDRATVVRPLPYVHGSIPTTSRGGTPWL